MSTAPENLESEHWWRRPGGPGEVLALAIPLIVSTMSFSIMHFIDRMFLMWDSNEAMAAALPAGMVNWTVVSLPMGIAAYANTFVAQYYGANRKDRIGAVIWQAIWIGIAAMPFFFVLSRFSPQLFTAFGHSPSMVALESSYLKVLCLAACAVPLNAATCSYYVGRGKNSVVMWVNIISAIMNIVLDYWWIFGGLGVPAGGVEGAAYATAVSQWFKFTAYFVLMFRGDQIEIYGLRSGCRVDWRLLKRFLYFGAPNGIQFCVEGAAMATFTLLVARLGELEAAATGVAFNVNMIGFIPMVGVSTAIATLVGQHLGGNRPDLAARSTWTGIGIGLIYTFAFGVMYLFMPGVFMFGHDVGADEFYRIKPLAIVLLRFVAAYCVFDAVQHIFVGALKGAGDTMFVLWATVVTSGGFVLLGGFGAAYADWGIQQWWMLLTAWLVLLSVIYGARFLQGKWRTMRVIEEEFQPPLQSLPDPPKPSKRQMATAKV